jgi:cytochrome P450
VFVNLWGIHRNKKHWTDPDLFQPERFIHADGGLISNNEWLIPFNTGKLSFTRLIALLTHSYNLI